ncbi:MAG: dipeptide/oligopeptide/nickel ABC transporter ATP-binding protein [Firmicutes bacterium ZCTH02-B6]|nr:MAG: dipeptide/oligopeptide/nickel ABC transporter ATP-binding protein [Firmicutes bacterium ZCTH02-B6]
MMEANGFLRVEDLILHFRTAQGTVQAVDGVNFSLSRGRTMVIIGESGSGKSSLAKAILRLLPRNVQDYRGRVVLNGQDVMALSEERFRREIRWTRMALVPQAAQNSLNPVLRIEEQVSEPLLTHNRVPSREAAMEKVRHAFRLVGLPVDFLSRYPFELSGGMRQRTAIAMALVTEPDLIVLDEPTSALDVLTQANLMNVLKRIKREFGTTFILITHDIATASDLADDVAVMYAGQVVERASAERFYREPLHPYSKKLMASVPTLKQDKQLEFIPGRPPSLINPPKGCRFADRCPARFARCAEDPPPAAVDGRQVKCWLYH